MPQVFIAAVRRGLFALAVCSLVTMLAVSAGASTMSDSSPLGINLNGVIDWSTACPFLDLMKSSRDWISQEHGQGWDQGGPLDLDENGWIMSFPDANHFAERIIWTNHEGLPMPFSRLVVRWEGSGTVRYSMGLTRDAEASGPDRDVVIADQDLTYLIIAIDSVDPSDPIRNMTVVPEEHVERFDAGEVFHPRWIEIVEPFRALRFMDWMTTNANPPGLWTQRPRPEHVSYATTGVPIEVMVRLANELQADPWFCMPHLADDEYVRLFAEYVRDNLDPDLTAYVEHSNEVWNWIFPQTHYANDQGRARWTPTSDPADAPGNSFMQWHGMRTAQICDIWKQNVFAGQTHRVHCTLGVQIGYRGLEDGALNCPEYVAEGNTACYQHGIDSIGVTTYFSGGLQADACSEQIRTWFNDPDGGLTKAFAQLTDGSMTSCGGSITDLAEEFAYFDGVAKAHGLTMIAYEGGQHITGNGYSIQNDQDFIDFHIAINRDPRMYDRYMEMLGAWMNGGGSLLMHFTEADSYDKYGSWGALEYQTQAGSPKYDALVDFNAATDCWWEDCERTVQGTAGGLAPYMLLLEDVIIE
jgi:hypothetical protein